jgi:hypothetical protein
MYPPFVYCVIGFKNTKGFDPDSLSIFANEKDAIEYGKTLIKPRQDIDKYNYTLYDNYNISKVKIWTTSPIGFNGK